MILFVTTFDQTLYDHSAKRLIETFHEKQTSGRLLCCVEGMSHVDKKFDGSRVIGRDLSIDPDLMDWDEKYRKLCWKETSYWNKRAWQWYRKSAATRVALETECTDVRWLVWVDSDCEFLADISPAALESLADGAAVVYLKGRRGWTETGTLFYDLNAGARFFLSEIFACYQSGSFRRLDRWDDCRVFDHTRENFDPKLFRDIADPNERSLRVLDTSPFGKYLLHKKGSHLQKGIR